MRWKTKTFAFVFVLIGWLGYTTAPRAEDSRDPLHFTYARLYCAPDGNTHFQDMTAELRKENFAPPAPPIHIGSDFATSRAFFGGFDAGWGAQDLEKRLNHPTPAIQFGIVLQGTFSITTTGRRDEATASRQRVSIGGHLALQGTHHRRRRRARIPHVRSVSARRRALSVAAGVIHGRASRPHDVHVRFAPKASEIAVLPRIDARCQKPGIVAV